MRVLLNWLKNAYDNFPVVITENGYSDRAGNHDDIPRVYYYKHYINYMLKGDFDLFIYTVSQAYFALHETLHKVKNS